MTSISCRYNRYGNLVSIRVNTSQGRNWEQQASGAGNVVSSSYSGHMKYVTTYYNNNGYYRTVFHWA